MLATLLSVCIVSLNTGVISTEFWYRRTSKALLTTIKYLTWKLLPFRIKIESFFANWDFRIVSVIWLIIRVGRWWQLLRQIVHVLNMVFSNHDAFSIGEENSLHQWRFVGWRWMVRPHHFSFKNFWIKLLGSRWKYGDLHDFNAGRPIRGFRL